MEWNVTLWIRMVRMRLQLTETSTAMLTATVTEKASGTLIAKKIASTTDTANVTPTVRAVVAMTEKAIGKAIGQLIATTTLTATETANEMEDETLMKKTTAEPTAMATAT